MSNLKVGDKAIIKDTSGTTGGIRYTKFKNPGVVTKAENFTQWVSVTDADGVDFYGCRADRFEKVTTFAVEAVVEAPAPAPASKHWFVCVLDASDQPLPASKPRKYTSAEQARAVAQSMAEKNRGERFVVYEATDVMVAAKPVVLPPAGAFKL